MGDDYERVHFPSEENAPLRLCICIYLYLYLYLYFYFHLYFYLYLYLFPCTAVDSVLLQARVIPSLKTMLGLASSKG